MYIQRYIARFPAAGEVVIFDRSWYNRAGVERVMGFCTPEETQRFLELTPGVEKAMADSGILLLKYWLEVSPDEQTRRLPSSIDDPRKIWKLSDLDLCPTQRWTDYSRARDRALFATTDTAWAPWWVAHSDDKKRARLNVISHLLDRIPYAPLEHRAVELPDRQLADDPRAEHAAAVHPDPLLTHRHRPEDHRDLSSAMRVPIHVRRGSRPPTVATRPRAERSRVRRRSAAVRFPSGNPTSTSDPTNCPPSENHSTQSSGDTLPVRSI